MINGVEIKKLKVYKDNPDLAQKTKPGILMEVLRADDGLIYRFGQSNFTICHRGTIKAFHWHKYQDDLWFVAAGKAGIVLYDRRLQSSTFGETEVIYAGEDDYKLVVIPKGVAHGYKALSMEPCLLFYHTSEVYDRENPDEQRIDPYDKEINFKWGKLKLLKINKQYKNYEEN